MKFLEFIKREFYPQTAYDWFIYTLAIGLVVYSVVKALRILG